MEHLIQKIEEECADRASELLEKHALGYKLVEYTGTYVPEELILASGALAYPMWRGGEPEPPDAVLDESIRFLNPLARTQYGLIKLGLDPVATEADIYATSQVDCHEHRIAELIERFNLPICKIGVPTAWTSEWDLEYYAGKIDEFKTRLEIITGSHITKEALNTAITTYNSIRTLFRRIDGFRKSANPPISGTQFQRLNHCSMMCSPDKAIEYLQSVLNACESAKTDTTDSKPRFVMFGHAIAQGDYVVTRALERAGSEIVHEIMDDAYFRYEVDVAENTDDPLAAICKHRYLDLLPNDNMQPSWDMRRKAVLDMKDAYGADGIVWYDLLYDEIYDMEYACMAEFLGSKNIPLIRIQSSYEYTREAMGPLNTRVETFVASIKGGK